LTKEDKKREVEVRPRNWLVPVILLTLREWNSYGYELMERTAAFGFEAMNPGTLYRTLRQMEKEGVVESKWETSKGGPARRMYTITTLGKRTSNFLGRGAGANTAVTWLPFSVLYTGSPNNERDDTTMKRYKSRSRRLDEA
jgi:poly-beta-hydroxybutyrate-responsive repressor